MNKENFLSFFILKCIKKILKERGCSWTTRKVCNFHNYVNKNLLNEITSVEDISRCYEWCFWRFTRSQSCFVVFISSSLFLIKRSHSERILAVPPWGFLWTPEYCRFLDSSSCKAPRPRNLPAWISTNQCRIWSALWPAWALPSVHSSAIQCEGQAVMVELSCNQNSSKLRQSCCDRKLSTRCVDYTDDFLVMQSYTRRR